MAGDFAAGGALNIRATLGRDPLSAAPVLYDLGASADGVS